MMIILKILLLVIFLTSLIFNFKNSRKVNVEVDSSLEDYFKKLYYKEKEKNCTENSNLVLETARLMGLRKNYRINKTKLDYFFKSHLESFIGDIKPIRINIINKSANGKFSVNSVTTLRVDDKGLVCIDPKNKNCLIHVKLDDILDNDSKDTLMFTLLKYKYG